MYDFSHVDVNTYSYPSLDQLDSLQVLGEIQATSNNMLIRLIWTEVVMHCPAVGVTQAIHNLCIPMYTVDGSEIQRSPVEVSSLSHYLRRV